jgi:hypothetical protein
MTQHRLSRQLRLYEHWRQRQERIIAQLEPWLKQQGLYTAEAQTALQQARRVLDATHIRLAVFGEFSRGKTELINALFFADLGARLLPTDAGRTTMCPTELFQDDAQPPYLELLPIATRLEEEGLVDLMQLPERWQRFPLDLRDTESVRQQLLRIKEVDVVSATRASELGFDDAPAGERAGTRIVPRWRMARINHRHPLLAEGLRIFDTPGLNTLGSEPELTYEILPNAHVKLFVLGTDTGVTRSDRDIWDQLVRLPGERGQRGLMVVLNKMDVLWDELRSSEDVQDTIERQRQHVGQVLEVDTARVFCVSAQKSLVGRIRQDQALEARSGMPLLESFLADSVVRDRVSLVQEQSLELVKGALSSLQVLVDARSKRLGQQITELHQISSESESAIDVMLKRSIANKERYQISLNAYKQNRQDFLDHGQHLLEALSPARLEELTNMARRQMVGAWTTGSLKLAMERLFEQIHQRMLDAGSQSQQMRRLLRSVYRQFRSEHDFSLADPRMFSIVPHQVALNLVRQEAEIFRNSPRAALTEQHLLVKRYFQTVVRRTSEIFRAAHNEARDWLETALDPLTMQIHEHRKLLNDELEGLRQAGRSRATVRQRIQTLEGDRKRLAQQFGALRKVHQLVGSGTAAGSDEAEDKLAILTA